MRDDPSQRGRFREARWPVRAASPGLASLVLAGALLLAGCDEPLLPEGPAGSCTLDPCGPGCPIDCGHCPGVPLCLTCERPGLASCGSSADCGDPDALVCEEGCCVELCPASFRCAGAPGCAAAALGCACDRGSCVVVPCSADEACAAGQRCVAGACGTGPALEEVARCELGPKARALLAGETLRLHLLVSAADGSWLAVPAGALFASAAPAVADVDGSGLVTAGAEAGVATLEAQLGAARCAVEVQTLVLAPGELLARVVDEPSGLPIAGAIVQLERPDGGVPLRATTGPDGVARFPDAPPPPRTLTAFDAGHGYLTVAGLSRADVLLPLRRSQGLGGIGGFKGRFVGSSAAPDAHVGLAGASIPETIGELTLEALLGRSLATTVDLGTPRVVQLPSGLTLGLGQIWFKRGFQASGAPSTCTDGSPGRCGVRAGWGLFSSFPEQELPLSELGGELGGPWGDLALSLLPMAQHGQAGVHPDLAFDLHPLTRDAHDDLVPDYEQFTEVGLAVPTPRGLSVEVAVPPLPARTSRSLEGAVGFVAAGVPGRGLVVLGLSSALDAATQDESADGLVNDRAGRSRGVIPLHAAPAHAGAVPPYLVGALALPRDPFRPGRETCVSLADGSCRASALVLRAVPALESGSTVQAAGPFLPLPDRGRYSVATRLLEPGAAPDGATLLAATLRRPRGSDPGEWVVVLPAGAASLTLPEVPEGLEDRGVRGESARPFLQLQLLRSPDGLDERAGLAAGGVLSLAGIEAVSTAELP